MSIATLATAPAGSRITPVPPMQPHVPPERAVRAPTRPTVRLARGNVLRIRDGAGTELTSLSGVLWVTEERKLADIVLMPGETHRIDNDGVTVAHAHCNTRLAWRSPRARPPRSIELAAADGEPGRRIAVRAGRARGRAVVALLARLASRIAHAFAERASERDRWPTVREWFAHETAHVRGRGFMADVNRGAFALDDALWRARDERSRWHSVPYY